MIKKNYFFLFIIAFVLLVGYAYQADNNSLVKVILPDKQTTDNILPKDMLSFFSDEENECKDPEKLSVTEVMDTNAKIAWDAGDNTKWEYYLQEEGIGLPSSKGAVSTTSATNTVSFLANGDAFEPNTVYEFFVRTICEDGTLGEWVGPKTFRTLCLKVNVYPFTETFNSTSGTIDCWTIITDNKSSSKWTISKTDTYEGDGCMYSYNMDWDSPTSHWLISPTFEVKKTNIYELSFYYKTSSWGGDANFELLASNNGIDLDQFTTVLESNKKYSAAKYVKKTYYIKDFDGTLNVAWHATGASYQALYIDQVTLNIVDCVAPKLEDIKLTKINPTDAGFTWTDPNGISWEYFVQAAGASTGPTGSGSASKSNTVTVTSTTGAGAAPLKDNTDYEFFLRSSCAEAKFSSWIGPFKFRTTCLPSTIPFWEGFNADSETFACWTILNINNNANPWGGNIWEKDSWTKFEGTHGMIYSGSNSNDWLITPTFDVVATKKYRLRYHYRSSSWNSTDFEVLLSKDGPTPVGFKTKLLSKKNYSSDTWKEERIVFGNITGKINIGWFLKSETKSYQLYIDNVFLEEITCPEPMALDVKDITDKDATIFWEDEFGKNWEYFVDFDGSSLPKSAGTKTTSKSLKVTVDNKGNALKPNTAYEYYVRTDCGGGDFSDWSGPIKFRTACSIVALPFWEGFNNDSETFYCWSILDINNDGAGTTGKWYQERWTKYEGSHSMGFSIWGTETTLTDDWLISPTFTFTAGKIYRLKYHYQSNGDFEVMASNKGINPSDFTKEVVKNKKYEINTFVEKKVFITGLAGNVNLGWHIKGKARQSAYIDNVFVEEVIGCPEPLGLDVKDIDQRSATLTWTDDFGATAWEYFVQPVTSTSKAPTGAGTATTKKDTPITVDHTGATLDPNTQYEYYVRTKCADGSFSIWAGPLRFFTLCSTYDTPFWDGFNTDVETWRCWTMLDMDNDGANWGFNEWDKYEGDRGAALSTWSVKTNKWLISPTINTTNDLYVLKYHYKTTDWTEGTFEVVLSNKGPNNTADFTQMLVPMETHKINTWKEKVVFFTAPSGTSNIAWHVQSTKSQSVYIDNVFVKKVTGCPEPYYVKTTNVTTTSVDIEWQQDGGITSWEVIVVPYASDETATPIQTITVTGSPKTTITGLSHTTAYTIYVRAKCPDNKSSSDWSTPLNTGTKADPTSDCGSAIKLKVNQTSECIEQRAVSTLNASATKTPMPSCFSSWSSIKSIWFEFTATSAAHKLSLNDLMSLVSSNPTIYVAVYEKNCTSLGTPVVCSEMSSWRGYSSMLIGLTPGKDYVIHLGVPEGPDLFNVCLSSANNGGHYLEVSPSGEKYTTEELISDVLINSNCKLISNVKYQAGDGKSGLNTLAYFNRGQSDFPFKEGIVLSTHDANYIPGPYRGFESYKPRIPFWTGDPDLNKVIDQIGGSGFGSQKAVAVLEFDFIPVKDSIKFEYIFVSDSFNKGCAVVCNPGGALFAAWLTEIETGEGQNLALVPGTKAPIAISTIRDAAKSGASCGSINPQYYDKNYDNNQDDPIDAPVNYTGVTVPMSSELVAVKPGKKYHIKLAIADFCGFLPDASSVFFNAGSFDLGNLNLGADLLVDTGNALCGGESKLIKSGISEDKDLVEIKWYKDDVLIKDATSPNYEVTETGTYKVIARYKDIDCEVFGQIKVEIFPAISKVVNKHKDLNICRFNLETEEVDLTSAEVDMFANVDRNDYQTTYYVDQLKQEKIDIPSKYIAERSETTKTIYMEIIDIRTGCQELFSFNLVPTQGDIPTKPEDVVICGTYTLPEIKSSQRYFTEPKGKGKEYKAGDVLTEGKYKLNLLQLNGGGCFEEVSFTIDVTEAPILKQIKDLTLECELFELPELPPHNKYFVEVDGIRIELAPKTIINQTDTKIFIVAQSENGVCLEETSFWVRYNDCPIPSGFSPNGDGINDTFDLSKHGVTSIKIYNRNGTELYSFKGNYTNQWDGKSKGGKELPSGTYYYVIQAFNKTRTGWVQINK